MHTHLPLGDNNNEESVEIAEGNSGTQALTKVGSHMSRPLIDRLVSNQACTHRTDDILAIEELSVNQHSQQRVREETDP